MKELMSAVSKAPTIISYLVTTLIFLKHSKSGSPRDPDELGIFLTSRPNF
jgi:hypothetical protein